MPPKGPASKRGVPSGPTTLSNMSHEHPIILGSDDQGRLRLRELTWAGTELPGEVMLALALTEACTTVKRGKVFYLPPPTPQTWTLQQRYGLQRLPNLVYQPFVWGTEDQKMWSDMDWPARAQSLHAKTGGLRLKDPVLPIDAVYRSRPQEHAEINGLFESDAGCRAFLAVVPQGFVGWKEKLLDLHPSDTLPDLEQSGKGWAFRSVPVSWLEEAFGHQTDCAAITQRLWDMYFDSRPSTITLFEEILRAEVELRKDPADDEPADPEPAHKEPADKWHPYQEHAGKEYVSVYR